MAHIAKAIGAVGYYAVANCLLNWLRAVLFKQGWYHTPHQIQRLVSKGIFLSPALPIWHFFPLGGANTLFYPEYNQRVVDVCCLFSGLRANPIR